jgi:Squalene/phytoene synthase
MTPDVLDEPTKTHRGENFPVASLFIAPRHRSVILAFYRFARGADDVADNASLTPDAKLALLDQFEATLTGWSDAILKRSDFKCGLESAEPVVHANPHLIEARSLERSGGRVKIFDLRAPIRRKPYSMPAPIVQPTRVLVPEQGKSGRHISPLRDDHVEEGESGPLEPQADCGDRALQHSVEAALPQTAALRIIDLQRPVADHARPVQAVEFEIVRVAAERLPADLAADAEAADVALELEFVARGQLLSDANAKPAYLAATKAA